MYQWRFLFLFLLLPSLSRARPPFLAILAMLVKLSKGAFCLSLTCTVTQCQVYGTSVTVVNCCCRILQRLGVLLNPETYISPQSQSG